MQANKQFIFVTFQHEGIHMYPAAATDPALAEVSFLGYPHRHMFHFRVEMEVKHNDRDVEFILLKRELESLYSQGNNSVLLLNGKSCEMIAEELADYIVASYPGRELVIEVSEDGENGARMYFNRT